MQILSTPDTTVFAGARSPDKAKDLQELSEQYPGRLYLIALDLSDAGTVQVIVQCRVDRLQAAAVRLLMLRVVCRPL